MKMKNKKVQIMAMIAVFVMLAVCIVPVNDDKGLDAIVGDGGSYTYTLTYDSSAMASGTNAISISGMTPISHTGSSTTLTSMDAGSWTWDTTTGLGPFNSFYAAFDMTQGNEFYDILDPYDLTKTISGDSLSPIGNYNIMWVLPTVYLSSTGTTLTMSNDSSQGTAYAHTINGHTYKYLAYGVYEASSTSIDGSTVLTSASGVTPTTNITRGDFRTYAHNYTMSSSLTEDPDYLAYSMQWNYDQWQLYKDICFAVMNNTNSQTVVGNGHVYGSASAYTTGALDTMGPYAGNPGEISSNVFAQAYGSNSVKLFLENAWGGVYDFVDGVLFVSQYAVYIDSSDDPDDSKTGTYIEKIDWTFNTGYPRSIQTANARTWGYPGSTVGGGASNGLADYVYITSGERALAVGGTTSTDWTTCLYDGISCVNANNPVSFANAAMGSRLAFVFDAGPETKLSLDVSSSNSLYGTLGDGIQTGQATISLTDITPGTTLTVSDNTITVNDSTTTTITATPTASDTSWTYTFDGFYDGSTRIESTMTLTDSTVITAQFSRTTTTYTVFIFPNVESYGTVSPTSVVNLAYGTVITVSDNTMDVAGTTVTATPTASDTSWTYTFDGWYDGSTKIESTMTLTDTTAITAKFSRTTTTYTVTIVPNDESYGTVSSASVDNIAYGTVITVSDNTMDVDGTTVTATPSPETPSMIYTFDGWKVNDTPVTESYTVVGSVTITAVFTENPTEVTAILRYDSNGGHGSITEQIGTRTGTETAYTFTISSSEPTKIGNDFKGWATTPDASSAEYSPGGTIDVSYGQIVTLYAVYEEAPSMSIIEVAPYLAIIGIIIGITGAIFTGRSNGMDTRTMIEIAVGGAVAILAVMLILVPLMG